MLGYPVVGHEATERMHELVPAKSAELLREDITQMIYGHPTVSEAVLEAARGIHDQPVNG